MLITIYHAVASILFLICTLFMFQFYISGRATRILEARKLEELKKRMQFEEKSTKLTNQVLDLLFPSTKYVISEEKFYVMPYVLHNNIQGLHAYITLPQTMAKSMQAVCYLYKKNHTCLQIALICIRFAYCALQRLHISFHGDIYHLKLMFVRKYQFNRPQKLRLKLLQ